MNAPAAPATPPTPAGATTGTFTGRFAPTPSGDLHLGNLRTALVAWLSVRATPRGRFLVRIEDLDPGTRHPAVARRQLDDLAALGLTWDDEPSWQSDHLDRHHDAIARLTAEGRTYPCWCSRAEVRAATIAPHGLRLPDGAALPEGAYRGTCASLDAAGRAQRAETAGRPPALRLRAEGARVSITDRLVGTVTGVVDDLVLRRADGVPAYNLAVVVDDAASGVTEVVRGADLLASTPRQAHLADLLGLERPSWMHVPLAVGADGARLAKRHGAVTLAGFALLHVINASGMGLGDVKLAGPLGMLLGWISWNSVLWGVFLGFLTAAAWSIVLLLSRRATRSSHIAFGPFMLLGLWLALIWVR